MKRKENESFEDYKKRRKLQNMIDKFKASGRIFWDSSIKKTYRKKKN